MVKTHFSYTSVGIDLIAVFLPLNLHLAFEVLPELEDIALFGHDLVSKCCSSDHWLIVLLHVEADKVSSLLLDSLRRLIDSFDFLFKFFQSVFGWGGSRLRCELCSRLLDCLFLVYSWLSF